MGVIRSGAAAVFFPDSQSRAGAESKDPYGGKNPVLQSLPRAQPRDPIA